MKSLAGWPAAKQLSANIRLNRLRDVLAKTRERHAIALAPPTYAHESGQWWWYACGPCVYGYAEDSGCVLFIAPQAVTLYGSDGRVCASALELDGLPGLQLLHAAAERVPETASAEWN